MRRFVTGANVWGRRGSATERTGTNFKKQFLQMVKGQNNPPKDDEVNGKKGWLWENKEESSKFDRVTCFLALVLSDGKAIFLEQKVTGANLVDVAKKFEFEKVAKALVDAPK
jgi:hypothetical protein